VHVPGHLGPRQVAIQQMIPNDEYQELLVYSKPHCRANRRQNTDTDLIVVRVPGPDSVLPVLWRKPSIPTGSPPDVKSVRPGALAMGIFLFVQCLHVRHSSVLRCTWHCPWTSINSECDSSARSFRIVANPFRSLFIRVIALKVPYYRSKPPTSRRNSVASISMSPHHLMVTLLSSGDAFSGFLYLSRNIMILNLQRLTHIGNARPKRKKAYMAVPRTHAEIEHKLICYYSKTDFYSIVSIAGRVALSSHGNSTPPHSATPA
jgi:hypothetical protein